MTAFRTRPIHYVSGLVLATFILLHLMNHLYSLRGPDAHLAVMERLRSLYRQPVVETLLMAAVVTQIITGLRLWRSVRREAVSAFQRLHHWTGLYLAFFLTIHVSAVWVARLVLKVDSNFYFGAAGLNSFPFNLFFVPYYGLGVFSVFGHLAAVHRAKMNVTLLGMSPLRQAQGLVIVGILLAGLVLFGLTNGFAGYDIPAPYRLGK